MNQINPFIIEGYLSPEYFCDRVEETAILTGHLRNQRNVALIAPRRLGKSGLIHHCFGQDEIRNGYHTFYVDIYDTKNLSEFTMELGHCIFNTQKSKGRKVWESFVAMLKSLKTGISFDINGMPEWSVSLGEIRSPEVLLDEIFDYLEHADKPCLVAIDEFQVVADYPEKKAEAALRKRIQDCHNVHFIYSGSKRHMMTEIFVTQSRPFYNSSALMEVCPIDMSRYEQFANHHLHTVAKSISHEAFSHLYERFDGITWYIQYVLNVLYADSHTGELQKADIEEAIATILQRSSFAYQALLFQLASRQKELLRAIATEVKVDKIMSGNFLQRYHLTSSTVQGALKALLDRDFVTNEEGQYQVYDKFFGLWLSSARIG